MDEIMVVIFIFALISPLIWMVVDLHIGEFHKDENDFL